MSNLLAMGNGIPLRGVISSERVGASPSTTCTVTFNTNGSISTTGTINIGAFRWMQNNVIGNYEIFATLTSGVLTSGTTGSWLALSSARAWAVTYAGPAPGAAPGAVLTMQIRPTSALYTISRQLIIGASRV